MKKLLSLALALVMLLSLATLVQAEELPTFDKVVLGENTDLTASLKFLYHRTDREEVLKGYVAEFNKLYPNITVTYELITDYQETSLIRLSAGDWGDIMGIPTVDKDELPTYFISYGDLAALEASYNFMRNKEYQGQVYGMPSTGNANGIVYNKKVFAAAGITSIPKTPEEFIAALQLIKDNTDAIPLYTNYAAGWTMGGQWDAHIGGTSTGLAEFTNQILPHSAAPFADRGNGTGPYALYKVLYDAVANKLIEDDYTTTDWEGCKGMINNGQIGCLVLGSWAFSQMVAAGPNGADIGYMSFPITVDGKQYASAGADYCFGINAKAPYANQLASLYYVKWLTHESGFAYAEGGIPIDKTGEYPDLYSAFAGIGYVEDAATLPGEDNIMFDLNRESELNINNGGDIKVQKIIEHAFNGDMTFDEIMAQWNQAWNDAQKTLAIEVKY